MVLYLRLVPIPEDWPPINKEIIEKDIENKSSNSEKSNRIPI